MFTRWRATVPIELNPMDQINSSTGVDDGIVAEMLKTGHDGLLQVLARYFTDILAGRLDPPEELKLVQLFVNFKKGDAKEVRCHGPNGPRRAGVPEPD